MAHSRQPDLGTSTILLICFCFILLSSSCSTNDDQQQFEQQAWSPPTGTITPTDGLDSLTGSADPEDWRISPFYKGIVTISPAWPNPVETADFVHLMLTITGTEALTEVTVMIIDDVDIIYSERHPAPSFGPIEFRLQGLEFGRDALPDNARGYKRVLLIDQNNNLISYGDVHVI